MIEIEAVSRRYGTVQALTDVSFTVPDGCVTGFVGPNGAGKSTLMRIVMGLDRPDAGDVRHDGVRVDEQPAGRLGAGALLDPSWVLGRRRARDHLAVLAAAQGLPAGRVDEALQLTGLASVADRQAGTFSLGMRQRLGIAAALLGHPRSLILDEPVNGLDPDGVSWVRSLVRNLAEAGTAVLISSHLLAELAQSADRIVVIARGRVLSEGPLAALLSDGAPVTVAGADELERLAETCRAHGAQVSPLPGARLQVTGLEPCDVSRLALAEGLVLTHLSSRETSLEERFATLTTDHVDYHAGGVAH